jgi:hypothetical protein
MIDVDKRTLAALASGGNTVYAHGLQKTPDTVIVRWIASIGTAAAVGNIAAVIDATNVTLYNIGSVPSPAMEVSTLVFHSIMT